MTGWWLTLAPQSSTPYDALSSRTLSDGDFKGLAPSALVTIVSSAKNED
jgi:hypothetical protein